MSETINPAGWPRPSGYANGIVAEGRYLAISGQIGWDENYRLAGADFLGRPVKRCATSLPCFARPAERPNISCG